MGAPISLLLLQQFCMKGVLSLFLLLLSAASCFSQVVRGKITGRLEQMVVYAPLSVGVNNFGLPYLVQPDANGEFFYQSPNGRSGSYRISIDGDYSYYYLHSGDTLIFNIDKTKNQVTIAGARNKKFITFKNIESRFRDKSDKIVAALRGKGSLLASKEVKGASAADYYMKHWRRMFAEDLNAALKELDLYKADPFFDSLFYNSAKADIQMSVTYNYYYHTILINTYYPQYKSRVSQDRKELFAKFNIGDSAYYGGGSAWGLLLLYNMSKIIKFQKGSVRDSTLSAFMPGYQYTHYYKPEVQEYLLGNAIILNLETSGWSDGVQKMLDQLRQRFPRSEYIPAIESRRAFNEKQIVQAKEYRLLDSLKIESVSSLASYIKKPFIVSVWATWCPICKREFFDLKKVEEELANRGIKVVYICINVQEWSKGYLQDIGRFGLRGSNLRVSLDSPLGTNLRELLTLGKQLPIPYYALFSSDGKVLNHDLPLPSSSNFMKEVDKALRKD